MHTKECVSALFYLKRQVLKIDIFSAHVSIGLSPTDADSVTRGALVLECNLVLLVSVRCREYQSIKSKMYVM